MHYANRKFLIINTTELNLIDGGATVGTTAIADGDGLLHNDAGTMRVTTVQTFATYFASEITAMGNLVETGALNAGCSARIETQYRDIRQGRQPIGRFAK